MILVKIPLRTKNETFQATVGVNDKYLYDEIDSKFEKMLAQGNVEGWFGWGPFEINIKPKKAA